ncbi:hypothetical protein FRC07_011330, partial [Ceratobasidium sp. 392]
GFVFADPQLVPNQVINEKQGLDPDVKEFTHVLGNQGLGFEFRRPEAYERMAADKLGQELAHDATIWKLHLEEADEHDQELATLFSAILTAFLIESKDLLQQDPGDASVALLLSIAESQYRVEQGLPFPSNISTSPTIPKFSPSTSERWINGIWFTSLGLALAATLIAMLGKEWLTAFLASRPCPAHSHALLRQSRLEGLERWWALHIIALLPSLLHASLLLFAVGLVVYLWTLDEVVALVIGVTQIVGLTSLFYIFTAILGAVYEFCPFVTQVSGYVRRATVALLGRNQTSENITSEHHTLKDMQALLWLANNARNPAVVDCSYQALSGLRHQIDPGVNQRDPEESSHPAELPPYQLPMQLDRNSTLNALLGTVIERFEKLTAGSLDLASADISAARYLNAITAVSAHIRHLLDESPSDQSNPNLGRRSSVALVEKVKVFCSPQTGLPVSPFQLLGMIGTLWNKKTSPLSANTYASILVSAMEIVQLVVPSMAVPGPNGP